MPSVDARGVGGCISSKLWAQVLLVFDDKEKIKFWNLWNCMWIWRNWRNQKKSSENLLKRALETSFAFPFKQLKT